MPPKGKAKNAPNQHDKRHESGLAPPGKRVVKQRSNTQLNGSPNGKPISPPALPSTGLNQGFKFPRPSADNSSVTVAATASSSAAAAAPTITVAAARGHVAAAPGGRERDRTASDASGEDAGSGGEAASHHVSDTMPVPMGGPEGLATALFKGPLPPSTSPFSAVSTILTNYPLRDAISILILLLSLPPTLVLVIQTLFASLTFVPPTAGLSLSTLPNINIKEMFNSSNFGYPALATILIVDLVFWVCWLPVWKPLQNIFLDLSQAVIAVSLSGAAAGTGGPTYSIATCTFIVCVVHVLRYKAIHLTALDYLRSVIHRLDVGFDFDAPSFAAFFSNSSPIIDRGWAFTVFRTILGIHIVSQGVTACVRRSLVQANERDHSVPVNNKTDTEAAAGVESTPRSNSSLAESSPSAHTTASNDGRSPAPSSSHRESRTRESSKKKRKQANQVRSQQPLWAAIASTKVTFVKEMEQRDAADDAREAAAMNNDSKMAFANASVCNTDRIWVCEVRDTEIDFCVELSPQSAVEKSQGTDDGTYRSTGIDKTKPFYVCINGAAWSSTRIMAAPTGEETHRDSGDRYSGEIFGLAPLGTYHCEIVGMTTQKVLCSINLVTQPAPTTAEQAISMSVQTQHQTLRPSSPITTLRQSIQSAEAKLNEVRSRTKKSRKDLRNAYADVKKEISQLRIKIDSFGGADDKHERRLLQISQHKKQAEDATAETKKQIEALGDVPEDELTTAEASKRRWQTAVDARDAATRDLEEVKIEHDRELSTLKSDIAASEAKKEKLMARNAQRSQDLVKLTAKFQADNTAKQRREAERLQAQQERSRIENEMRFHINSMESEASTLIQRAQEYWLQSSAHSNWGTQPPPGYSNLTSPPTPEGILPGTSGAVASPSNGYAAAPAFNPPQPFNPAFHTTHSPVNEFHPSGHSVAGVPRGRSSSMLSQYSGFTDNGDEYNYGPPEPRQQHSWPSQGSGNTFGGAFDDRKGSEGDGSGTGSGGASLTTGSTSGSNSPRPDARPFIPTVGPIAPPSKTSQTAVSDNVGAIGSGR